MARSISTATGYRDRKRSKHNRLQIFLFSPASQMAEDLVSPSGSPRASLETTPLLSDQPNEDGQDNPSSSELSSGARPRAPRTILILTLVSLCVSVVCSGLVISVNIAGV